MGNKKYYWLKLENDFFEDDTILYLEEQENGKDYVIFYLKLLLKSLNDNGKLIRVVGSVLMPYDARALAKLTNTNIDTVTTAMNAFEQIGLVKKLDTGEIYMTQIDEMIGSETASAKRVRKHRALKEIKENNMLENKEALHCNSDVTKCNTDIDIEIDKEIDKDTDKDTDTDKEEAGHIPFKEIIDYLNEKADKRFRSVESNNKHIRARYNEGYELEDFKQVIDIKVSQWLNDNKMKTYIRPSTLFGTKFDTYLNEEIVEAKVDNKNYNSMEEIEIDGITKADVEAVFGKS